MSNVTGVNSGPQPPENGMMKVFTIMINDTKPVWIYCATKGHCQKGMVMAINAPTSGQKTLQAYKDLAKKFVDTSANSTNTTSNPSPPGGGSQPPKAGSASSLAASLLGTTGIAAFVFAAVAFLL
jgi:hypothetical protein